MMMIFFITCKKSNSLNQFFYIKKLFINLPLYIFNGQWKKQYKVTLTKSMSSLGKAIAARCIRVAMTKLGSLLALKSSKWANWKTLLIKCCSNMRLWLSKNWASPRTFYIFMMSMPQRTTHILWQSSVRVICQISWNRGRTSPTLSPSK